MSRALVVGVLCVVVAAGAVFAVVQADSVPDDPPRSPLPQPPDSDAPPGAPPHWIPPDDWVQQHWLPFDEDRLYRMLDADRRTLWRHLRDDRRTLAQLAADRGWPDPRRLAAALVAPRRTRVSAGRAAELERRTLRTLTQGHLSQHVLFHTLHQEALPSRARTLFGVSTGELRRLRRLDISPLQIARMHGRSAADVRAVAERELRAKARLGVRTRQVSAEQAALLVERQLRQLPRWLREAHYNGPPPTDDDGRLSEPPRPGWQHPVLTADGDRVVFEAYEPKLPLARTRGEISVVAWNAERGRSEPVSGMATDRAVGPFSAYNPAVSASGRFTAFETSAGNLNFAKRYGDTRVVVVDDRTGRVRDVSAGPAGTAYAPAISGDGRVVAFQSVPAGGTERGHATRIVVRRLTGGPARAIPRPPVAGGARPGADAFAPSLSRDGRRVAFTAPAVLAGGRVADQVYVLDRSTRRIELVSRRHRTGPAGDAESWGPKISADGRRVAFASTAGNLGGGTPSTGASHILIRDLGTGRTRLVSARDGRPLDGFADQPAISADGSAVAFSVASLRDRARSGRPAQAVLISDSRTPDAVRVGDAGATWSGQPSISKDGRRVAFASDARGTGDGTVRVRLHDASARRLTDVASPTSFAPGKTKALASHDEAVCRLAPPAW